MRGLLSIWCWFTGHRWRMAAECPEFFIDDRGQLRATEYPAWRSYKCGRCNADALTAVGAGN